MVGRARTPGHRPDGPATYGYTAQDDGWGCVYRSVQNVQSFLGLPVTPLEGLVDVVGRGWAKWAEPADFTGPRASRVWGGAAVPKAYLVGASTQWLKYTTMEQYRAEAFEKVFGSPTVAPDGTTAFVVDDGISGYAVVPHEGAWWWVDPHTLRPPVLKPDVWHHLDAKPGWMVLKVVRTKPTEPPSS
jgi:hypothetical protein